MNEIISIAPKGLLAMVVVIAVSVIFFGILTSYSWLVEKTFKRFEKPRKKNFFGYEEPKQAFDASQVGVAAFAAIFIGPLGYLYAFLDDGSDTLSSIVGTTVTCLAYLVAYLILS